MKWILFTGTWRLTNQEVEDDVRKATREVISSGNGIVTGGQQELIILRWMRRLSLTQQGKR